MTPSPITISPQTTLPEAHRLMEEHSIRRLPVLHKGKLIGLVTRGDLRGAQASDATTLSIYELNYLLDRTPAKDFMAANPITIAPTATLAEAAYLMLHHKIGGLPVIEADHLIGMLTETDLCRYLTLEQEMIE